MGPIIWLFVFIVLVGVEIATLGLATIWFAGGAAVAFIATLLGAGIALQLTLFIAVSVILLVFTRPIAVRYINKDKTKTNVDSMAGKKVKVLTEVNNLNDTGRVSVNGIDWEARSEADEMIFKPGSFAIIKRVEGVKLIITELMELKED